eukprot:gb/GFBE01008358.1/.p1 GENE.gb/GFBE01008358.1/~~gb/GFBE01008358.1/.p1  ORF type:complete len:610 (+),score=114.03 gb/GFBE01008358.1/:1-1830(+)
MQPVQPVLPVQPVQPVQPLIQQPHRLQPQMQVPQPPPPPLTAEEFAPWLDAAKQFVMNSDFDVGPILAEKKRNITQVMDVMKANSGGKGTIQALGDKIILSRLLDNLGVPQMPLLHSTYSRVNKAEVEKLVSNMESSGDPDAYDVVIKPTHLSSCMGALVMSKQRWEKEGYSAAKLISHMEQFLGKKAADCESEALKSLVPGFIIQPRYRSTVGFGFPLEMRIVTLWGKARVGIWWWGRQADPKGRRTTWLVRCPKTPGKLSNDDDWEAIHEHSGDNKGFEVALALFKEAMPGMAAAGEAIAAAVGAPFLRSDFFVGSSKWGVRLNEVAYGSGVDYKRRLRGGSSQFTAGGTWHGGLVDDGPAIAEILQEGFRICQRKPPAHFLRMLGAKNAVYEAPASLQIHHASKPLEPHMRVEAVPPEKRLRQLPEDAVQELVGQYEGPAAALLESGPISAASCETQAAPDPPGAWPFRPFRNMGMGGYPQRVVVNSFAAGGRPSMYRANHSPPPRRALPQSLSFVAVPPQAVPAPVATPVARPVPPVVPLSLSSTMPAPAAIVNSPKAMTAKTVTQAAQPMWHSARIPPSTVRYGLASAPSFVTTTGFRPTGIPA